MYSLIWSLVKYYALPDYNVETVELEDNKRQLLIIFSRKWVDGVKGNKNYIVYIDGKLNYSKLMYIL